MPAHEQLVVVDRELLGKASLGITITEHQLAEEKAKSEFEREEARKDNDCRRRREESQARFELYRDAGVTAVLIVLVLVALAYTGPWIVDAKTPSEARQLATGLWTLVISGGSGYLYGKRQHASAKG